jgi:hypothetical protein
MKYFSILPLLFTSIAFADVNTYFNSVKDEGKCQIYVISECEYGRDGCWEGGRYIETFYFDNDNRSYGPYYSYSVAQNESYQVCFFNK